MKKLKVYRDEGPIDISIIEKYEEEIGYKFPKAYKELISKHNGLYPENNAIVFPDSQDGSASACFVFLTYFENPSESNGDDITRYSLIRDEDNALRPHTVVFGDTGAGDMIAFDYSDNPNGDNPRIVFIWHDDWDDDTTEFVDGYRKTKFIANSFEEFIDCLVFDDDE